MKKKTQIVIAVVVVVVGGVVALLMRSPSKPAPKSDDHPAKVSATADANSPKTKLQKLLTQRHEKRKEALAAYQKMTPAEKQRWVQEQVNQRLGVNAAPSEAEKQARIEAFKEKLAAMTPASQQALLNQLRQEQLKLSQSRDPNGGDQTQAGTKPVTGK